MIDPEGPSGAGPPELGLLERIEAGTYYFGQGDYDAARAWWQYALDLDPGNARVRECLACLERVVAFDTGQPLGELDVEPEPPLDEAQLEEAELEEAPLEIPEIVAEEDDSVPPAHLSPASAWIDDDEPDAASGLLPPQLDAAGERWTWRPGDPGPPVEPPPPPEALMRPDFSEWEDGGASNAPPPVDPLDFAAGANAGGPPSVDSLPSYGPWDDAPAQHAGAAQTPAPAPAAAPAALLSAACDRLALDDLDGALDLLRQVPDSGPFAEEARDLSARAEQRLLQLLEAKLGSTSAVPRILLSEEQIIWMSMNHRVGYVLSQIDGLSTFDDLLALSGMPRIETLRILCGLVEQGVITA